MNRENKEQHRRTLISVPVVHTEADMGGLKESVRRATFEKMGKSGWKRKVNALDRYWSRIETLMDGLDISYERVRLYQDGLPVCGKESKIVRDLAGSGSRNHRLLLKLMQSGATIMGTESLELLMEEYNLAKQALTTGEGIDLPRKGQGRGLSRDSLLERRDRFIADRINRTLRKGETGILFLGMLHSLEHMLAQDIRVVSLFTGRAGR